MGSGILLKEVIHASLEEDGIEVDDHNIHSPVNAEFPMVGYAPATGKTCGEYLTIFDGCSSLPDHAKIMLNGVNYTDTVYMLKRKCSCGKLSCVVCSRYGAAVREAYNIQVRLEKASKTYGEIEHGILSFPKEDHGLSYEALMRKAKRGLKARGWIGEVKFFHGSRYKHLEVFEGHTRWVADDWSPHVHVLGFLDEPYEHCRNCGVNPTMENCRSCGGYEFRTRKARESDGLIVKIKAKRKTIGGTAWYILNHSSMKKGVVRFHVATWTGVVSYRKMKLEREEKKRHCPICGKDLKLHCYIGRKRFVDLCMWPSFSHGDRGSVENAYEDGRLAWVEVPSGSSAAISLYMKSVYGVDI